MHLYHRKSKGIIIDYSKIMYYNKKRHFKNDVICRIKQYERNESRNGKRRKHIRI